MPDPVTRRIVNQIRDSLTLLPDTVQARMFAECSRQLRAAGLQDGTASIPADVDVDVHDRVWASIMARQLGVDPEAS